MRKGRAWLLVLGVAALACALAAAAAVAARTGPGRVPSQPLAIVLVPGLAGSDVVSVDLDTGRVVGRVRLRSLATDIDVDPVSGNVVAAQTGGLGHDADNALSIVEPRSGIATYVRLPQVDPSQVECVGGRAMVLHAVIQAGGFAASGVDVASGRVAVDGHVPEGTGLWAAAAGTLWTTAPERTRPGASLVRVDPATLATTAGPAVGFPPNAVVSADGSAVVLGGSAEGNARVAVLDSALASVTAEAGIAGLPHGAQLGVGVGGVLVVGDWNGEQPETSALRVIDLATLKAVRTLDVGGAPCALAAYGGRVLVVDRVSGTLVRLDPRTGHIDWRADLGARDLVCSKVVVSRAAGGAAGAGRR